MESSDDVQRTEKREEFDILLGGETSLPANTTAKDFINFRIKEIEALAEAIENPQRTGMVFQQLPKKMRRRVMSHNAKRMPNRLKQAHTSQLDKCSAKEVGKRPSRKYRRRPSNLRCEYARRQRSNAWLETHIWHAKRFHMVNQWGYRLPDFPNDKSYKACYRASAKHCLLQDVSFLCCLEFAGGQEEITSGLSLLSDDCFVRKPELSGQREGTATFKHPDGKPIGEVNFMWKREEESDGGERKMWIWCHPAFSTELYEQLQQVFKSSRVNIESLAHQLLRFRLIGPKCLDVLSGALRPVDKEGVTSWAVDYYSSSEHRLTGLAEQNDYLSKVRLTCDPGQLPPRSLLPALVTTHLPRLPQALRQRDVDVGVTLLSPVSCMTSPLWDPMAREAISSANQRLRSNSKSEAEATLVPSTTPRPIEKLPLALILVHRPGRQNNGRQGYGCGVDVICPKEWGMRVWLCLVHNGGRAAGLRDFDRVETDVSTNPKFLPQSEASRQHTVAINQNNRDTYFRLPPAKRPNYQKLGVSDPFDVPWTKLQEEWKSEELIRVYIISTGKLNVGCRIYLPQATDLEQTDKAPVEPLHPDPNKKLRSESKREHERSLRKIARQRKKLRLKDVPKEELPSSKEAVFDHRVQMERLWLGGVESVRAGNIRETMGFITEGGYSLLQGKCAGYGYVTSEALKHLKDMADNKDLTVLIRNNTSLQYIFAQLQTT